MLCGLKRRMGFLLALTGFFAIAASSAAADDSPVSGVYKANTGVALNNTTVFHEYHRLP